MGLYSSIPAAGESPSLDSLHLSHSRPHCAEWSGREKTEEIRRGNSIIAGSLGWLMASWLMASWLMAGLAGLGWLA